MTTHLVCHRGACLLAPENTFASAHKAIELGGDIIEMDIRQSKDGVLYVMHDETVDRTTNGSGLFADMQSDEIDALDAGSWFAPDFKGEPVPRLEDFLIEFKDRVAFYLEVKLADCEALALLIKKLDLSEESFTFSFDAQMRADMHTHAPWLQHMIIYPIAKSPKLAIEEHQADLIELHPEDFTVENINLCKEAGLKVGLYTPNKDEDAFKLALDNGVSYVNIDHLDLFNRVRDDASQGVVNPVG